MRAPGVLLPALVLVPLTAHAHKPSDSYRSLRVEGQQILGRWDIEPRDLENAIGLDTDGDGRTDGRGARTEGVSFSGSGASWLDGDRLAARCTSPRRHGEERAFSVPSSRGHGRGQEGKRLEMSHETTRFEEVYKVYHARIERYLVGLLGPAEAEDAVQEVFERISRKLASFRGDSELSTWVFRIARNAALDRLRVRRRRGREEARRREAGDTAEASLESPTDTLDESLARSEMGACIRDLIGDLPEPYRTVLVLSDLEGLNNREIAAELQVSLGAVKTRLHRARARLKRKLEAECTFDHDPRLGLRCEPRRVRPRNDASRR